jgi:hypothetical protein
MTSVSPPVVIEAVEDGGTKWSLSFGGHNPTPDLNVETDKETAWRLHDLIMRIDPSLLRHATERLR